MKKSNTELVAEMKDVIASIDKLHKQLDELQFDLYIVSDYVHSASCLEVDDRIMKYRFGLINLINKCNEEE